MHESFILHGYNRISSVNQQAAVLFASHLSLSSFRKILSSCMKRLLLFIIISFVFTSLSAQTNIVQTEDGKISGTTNADKTVRIYKGIPFADPPVGALRWKAPQTVTHWQGVKQCDAFAASPMQNKPVPFAMYTAPYLIPPSPISEDCLYLNVWTPVQSSLKKPVMVWIYGGGFVSGGTACPIYDGENMAMKGVVFVSVPYRVGVFGFLTHPQLSKESDGKASGNYAFLDLLAALHWVHQNISGFGGDPNNVTLIGQSAGAFSVNALVASPLAKGLFSKAIAESGGMFSADGRAASLRDAEQKGKAWAQKTGAASIDELRKLPADSLQKLSASFTASPVIDGYVLPKDIYSIFTNDEQNDVPVLTGWNKEDGFRSASVDSATYLSEAKEKYGALADAYLEAFPGGSKEVIGNSLFALNRDNSFAWQAYTWARLQTTKGHHPIYLYLFSQTVPGEEKYGAFHSSEIPYALNTLYTWKNNWSDADKKLADIMSDYWTNFAKTGNPNGASLPAWAAYQSSENKVMVLKDDEQAMQPIEANKELQFLDRYQEYLRKNK